MMREDFNYYFRYWIFLLAPLLLVLGCGEGSPFDTEDSIPNEIPGELLAKDFPTTDGSIWEYISPADEHIYTMQINGIKNIGGSATRIQESDSRLTISQMGVFYGVPIRNSYFIKDLDSYTEHAFDLWLAAIDDTVFQRHSPKRLLWSFPLYKGREWIVSESHIKPEIIYTRRVISDKNTITIPAGVFSDVYYIEETVFFAELLPEEQIAPSKFWIAANVGIIKYEYFDPILNTTVVYELNDFREGK